MLIILFLHRLNGNTFYVNRQYTCLWPAEQLWRPPTERKIAGSNSIVTKDFYFVVFACFHVPPEARLDPDKLNEARHLSPVI